MNGEVAGLFISIYTDEDITSRLAPALRQRGYVALSAAEAGNLGLPDDEQLCYAAQHHYALLTANAQDFIPLTQAWFHASRDHSGIILTPQFNRRQFGYLLRQLLRLLDSLTREELRNQVVFLDQFSQV